MDPIYLALGDSLTTGYGVGPFYGFASLYFHSLSQKIPHLSYFNQGVNGLTTSELAEQLQANSRLQSLMAQARLITLTIGSNDVLHLARKAITPNIPAFLNRFETDMGQVGQSLRLLNQGASIQIASLYNPLRAGPYRDYASQGQALLDEANAILKHWAQHHRAALVPVGRAFRGQESLLIGPDQVHPNERGHALMASLFARAAKPYKFTPLRR